MFVSLLLIKLKLSLTNKYYYTHKNCLPYQCKYILLRQWKKAVFVCHNFDVDVDIVVVVVVVVVTNQCYFKKESGEDASIKICVLTYRKMDAY